MKKDLEMLTTNTAVKVSKYIDKLKKSGKVIGELNEEDIKRRVELHDLIWTLRYLIDAIDCLSPSGHSEELSSDIHRSAVSVCERINEIIKNSPARLYAGQG